MTAATQIIVHVSESRWLTLAAGAVTGIASAAIGAAAVLVAQGRSDRARRAIDHLERLEAFLTVMHIYATFMATYPSEEGKPVLDKITTRRDIIRHEGRLLERAWAITDQLWHAAVRALAVADYVERSAIEATVELLPEWKLGQQIINDPAWIEATAEVGRLVQRRRVRTQVARPVHTPVIPKADETPD